VTTTTTTPAAVAIAARYLLRPLTGYTFDHRPGGAPWLEVTGDYDPTGRALTLTGGVVLRPRKGSGAVHRWTRVHFTGGAPCGVWSGAELNAFTGLAPRKLPAAVEPNDLPLGAAARRMGDLETGPRGVTLSGHGLAALAALAPVEAGRYRFDAVHTTRGGVYATDGRAAIRLRAIHAWPGPDGEAPTFLVAGDVVRSALAAVKRYRVARVARLVSDPWGDVSGVELHAGGVSALFAGITPAGDFPPVDNVMPAADACPHTADPADAGTIGELTAAGRVYRRAGSGHRPVVALTPGGAARITGTPEEYPGAPLRLDPTYVAHALRAVGTPARILWADPARPCRVEGPDGVAVIMPVELAR
jgi:hypothetical protein